MKSGPASANTSETLLSILPVLLMPLGLVLLAVIITYFRRRQQTKANPQIRFDKPLWKACFDTFGAVVLIWAVLYFLFPIQNNQIRFSPQLSGLFANPIIAIGTIIAIPILISGIFLWYLMSGVKKVVYAGNYDAGLKFVRRWTWLPVMKNILTNLEGSILLMAGRFAEAEACFRKVEVATRNPKKNQRQPRGSNLGNLGWSLTRQAHYAEAIPVLQTSIELYPEGADNFSALGETLLLMGKPDDALPYLDRGIENKRYRMNTDRFVWGELLANRAWALAQSGDCDQALKTYQQALTETEQDCLPALAGLHVRGAYILRLCGDEAKAIGELNIALKMDPRGAYGQLAKAALQVPQERVGLAQLAIPADGATVVNAIRRSTPAQRTIKVARENLMLVAQGKEYSYVYLLRPQPDGTTVLQVVVDQTATVANAINNTNLKAGLTGLIANVKRTSTDPSYVVQHLQLIANAVSQPAPVTEAVDADVPATPESSSSFDTASVFARKPLPAVTAKDRPMGSLNPSWYASMSFVMTPLISSLVLSYFWRRLGKPSWMWISIAFAILLPIVGVGGALILARNVPPALQFSLILGGAGIWYGYSFALASILEEPYKKWHQGGKEALVNYPYKWGRGALVGVGTVAGAAILGVVLNVTQPGPQRFGHELMSLTYPPSWTVGDINKIQSCTSDSECFAWLYEKRFGYSNILFGRFHLNSTISASTVEHNTWNNLSRQNNDMTLETRDTVQINGMEAARRFFFYPANDPKKTDLVYGMQIYLVRGQYAYYISEWSANKGIFKEDKAAIDQMLSTYVLKAGVDGFASKPVRWLYPTGNPLVNWG